MTALAQIFTGSPVFRLPLERLQNDFGRFLQARRTLEAIAAAAQTAEEQSAAAQLVQTQTQLETQVADFGAAIQRLQTGGFEIGATVTVAKFAAQMESHLSAVDAFVARTGGPSAPTKGFQLPWIGSVTWPWLLAGGFLVWRLLRR